VWLTEPWAACDPPQKSPQNELVDFLVKIPGFLEDQLQLERSPSETGRQDLIFRTMRQLDHLYQWRWKWQTLNPDVSWEMEPQRVASPQLLAKARVFRKVLWFSSFTKATEIALYNAVLLCLLGLLWTLQPPPDQGHRAMGLSPSPLHLPGEANSLLDPAVEICRVFEFQLLNFRRNSDAALFWLLPVSLARRVLEDERPYLDWIRGMLDTSEVTRGYGTGDNVFGFGSYPFPKVSRAMAPRVQP